MATLQPTPKNCNVTRAKWSQEWELANHGMDEYDISITATVGSKFMSPRREEVAMARLRLRRSRVHQYPGHGLDDCAACDSPMDLQHWLCDCPTFGAQRETLRATLRRDAPACTAGGVTLPAKVLSCSLDTRTSWKRNRAVMEYILTTLGSV